MLKYKKILFCLSALLVTANCTCAPCNVYADTPSTVAESYEKEEMQYITFKGDVENGITNSITFNLYPVDAEYDEPMHVVLNRVNGYVGHVNVVAGYDYQVADIHVDDKTIKTEDFVIKLPEENTGIAIDVDVKIGDGCKGEINTNILDDRGITPPPPTAEPTPFVKHTKTVVKEKKKIPKIVLQIIAYGVFGGMFAGVYLGIRKLKKMWDE